ncbi:hypothetical protein [Paenibacillus sp. AN1007]|uniref:Translation elongation factor EFTu/EF1A C-terminal domain-containing protein n=1 Tax=Paenibacillus sp. AN1007 TaxID=3151385 RepID=A0AAU8N8E8_9BACL
MKKIAGVSLYFLTEAEGGQKGLITEDFSTPVVFDVDQDLRFGLWSVVVKLHCKPSELRQAQGELYYLFHDSTEVPHHLLEPGNTFSLKTNRTIAKGRIESIIEK